MPSELAWIRHKAREAKDNYMAKKLAAEKAARCYKKTPTLYHKAKKLAAVRAARRYEKVAEQHEVKKLAAEKLAEKKIRYRESAFSIISPASLS